MLAHEFWHALPDLQFGTRADGCATRTTGFWTEALPGDGRPWCPVEESLDFGVPTYLMNEAVAIEMEIAATGQDHPGMRPDLIKASNALHQLFGVAGRD